MQPLLTRLRSLRRERFDSSTGRRRRGGVAVAAGLALALFVGSGIAVAAVSSAEAHIPAIAADCTGVTVDATWYDPAVVNTVSVTITGAGAGGADRVESRTFGADFHEKFTFPDPSVGWTFTATIDSPDGRDGTEWDLTKAETSTPCLTPGIALTASACVHAGDRTAVEAQISNYDPSHAYSVRLTGNGYDSGELPVQTTSYAWNDLAPGTRYTATLTDTTTGLTGTAFVDAIGCPQDPGFDVRIAQCAAVGASGTFGVTVSGLVSGRSYVLALVNTAGGAPTEVPFTATGATFSNDFKAVPSTTYLVRVTDVADGSSKETTPVSYLPCPGTPELTLDPTACTATDGTSDASMVSSIDGLVPGRSYSITIESAGTTVYSETLAPATSSTWTKTLYNLEPGEYVLTVTDISDPAVTGLSVCTSTIILDCPSQQEVAFEVQQCAIPGGSGTLSATVTDFTVGRNYTVTLTQNGLPVAGQPESENFDPTDPTEPVFVYAGLTPGLSYRLIVQDVTSPTGGDPLTPAEALEALLPVSVADITLAECPGNPDLVITQPTCTLFTTSTMTVGASKLIAGETYTFSLTNASDGSPVAGVADQQVAATAPTATLQFAGVPVGRNYTITATNATKTLTATANIFLKLCDLPTLAYTGASTMTPTLAGLGFLQLGLVLVGISLVRRRSGAREV